MSKFALLALILVLAAASTRSAENAAEPRAEAGTKPIFGFEPSDLERIGGRFKKPDDKRSWSECPKTAPDNAPFLWRPAAGYPDDILLWAEERTEGALSRPLSIKDGRSLDILRKNNPGVFRRSATILRTCGWHRGAFGTDWSSHPRLWLDVRSSGAAAVIEVELEDDQSIQRLARRYTVPANRWVTLEYDLAGAAQRRLLDPARIASLYVLVAHADGPTRVSLDNFRLAGADAKCGREFVRDDSAWPVLPEPPAQNGRTTRPRIPALPATKPVLSSIPADEKAVTISGQGAAWGNSLHKVPRGIAAFDARHLASVFMAPTAGLRLSSDGGQSWTGCDGKACTVLASGNNTGNRHGFFCTPPEVLAVYLTHCAGGGSPTETYFRRVSFDGSTWRAGEPSVVDRDVRHCPEGFEVIRLNDGRLWAAWDHEDRYGRIPMLAKFSDDDGRTWQHGGRGGIVSPPLALGSLCCLAAFGPDGAMLLYSSRRDKQVFWTRFDQKAFDALYGDYLKQSPEQKLPWDRFSAERSGWVKPAVLPKGAGVTSAVGLADGRVFVAVSDPASILVWEESKGWSESLAGCSGLLTRAGADRIAVFYKDSEKDGRKILYRLLNGGRWSEPRTAAEEASAIKSLAVPQVSPPDFVPLAWSFAADANAIRTLRVGLK